MKRVDLSIDIDAPSSQIWAVLTDPPGFPKWIKGIQTVEMETKDPYDAGTRYHVTAGTGQRSIEWTVEITKVEPERRIDFDYTGDVEGHGGWLIESVEETDGSRVNRVTSFDEFEPPGGWLIKFLSRFWLDNAARSSRMESLERLKNMVEGDREDQTEDE
jgi:uncharacterized membrane protein